MTTSANNLAAEPKIYFDPTYSSVPDAMKEVDQLARVPCEVEPRDRAFR